MDRMVVSVPVPAMRGKASGTIEAVDLLTAHPKIDFNF
jgi:hypothetical protein